MNGERERSLNYDLLRIVAMLMIVCFHYCIHGNGEQIFSTSFSIQQVISYTFGSWGLVGVICFFMISAWFMQNRETISILKWLNLYVKVVIVFLMCLLIAKSLGENITARTLLEAILSPLNSSYWYVTAYMVMMFFVPWLNLIIRCCKDRNLLTITAISCFICFMLTPIFNFVGGKTGTSTVFLAISLYLVTACIKKKLILNKINAKILLIGYFLVVFVESGLSLIASMTGTVKISNHIYDLVDIYSPIPVILGIMTFIWFSEQSGQIITNKFIGGGIRKIAKHTFSIYLLHENPYFRYVIWDKVFRIDSMYYMSAWKYLLHLCLIVVLIYVTGIITDIIVSAICDHFCKLKSITNICRIADNYFNLKEKNNV